MLVDDVKKVFGKLDLGTNPYIASEIQDQQEKIKSNVFEASRMSMKFISVHIGENALFNEAEDNCIFRYLCNWLKTEGFTVSQPGGRIIKISGW